MLSMLKIIRIWFWVIVGWSVVVLPAWAGNNSGQAFTNWPDTGQTKCYNDSVEIPCPAEGAAFHGQDAQYLGPARSYSKLDSTGNTLPDTATSYAMVKDNVTGLVWEQKTSKDGTANYSDPHDADNTYTWCDTNPDTNGGNQGTCGTNDTMDFLVALNGANFGGHNDWRLPTINELATLVDLGRSNPAIDPVFAATTQWDYVWSSTTYAKWTVIAWVFHFYISHNSNNYKSSSYYVRAVRGGQ